MEGDRGEHAQQQGRQEQDPRPQRTKSGKRLQWDEQNLLENAQIQASFAGVTIPEPKTPYHGPSPPDDLDDDLRPLALGDDGQRVITAFDYVMSNGGAEFGQHTGGASPPAPSLAAGVASADVAARGRALSDTGDGALSSGKRSERSVSEARSFTSSENSGGLSSEKRQRFEAARRAHYNMRAALRLGRQLTSASGDDSDGRGADGSGGSGDGPSGDEEDEHMRDCGSSRLNETGRGEVAAGSKCGSEGAQRNVNGGASGTY